MSAGVRAVLLIVAVSIGATRLNGQSAITGRVVDPSDKPVANVAVLLHAITESTGSQVAEDTSGIDGRFELRINNANPKAIYFVAVTYKGQLFMGDMLRPPFPSGSEYIVRVGVNPVDFSQGPANPTPSATVPVPQNESRTAGTVVIVAAIALIAGVGFVVLRRRPPEHRRMLVELARLEDEIAATASPSATLERRRRELREQLLDSNTG